MNPRSFLEWFNRAIEPFKNRLMLMVNRAVITSTNDSKAIQTVQVKVLAGETKKEVPCIQHFGFSSHAPASSDAIMISVNGNRENSAIIGSENREFRFKSLDEGDAVIYNKGGKFVHVKGENVEMLLDKLIINNSSHEMVSVLSEFMQGVIDGLNETAIGPMPLTPATIAALTLIKDKLDTFKV